MIGPKTESAIMDFQNLNGLKATGVLDTVTIDAILKSSIRGGGGVEFSKQLNVIQIRRRG
ncbi:MAG: peptidoglycan-binding domain-containing protein [Candidatus Paceibacterota bacterium]